MLSYRHAFHAGNLADVLKHGVLCAVLRAATTKQSPLCYLETHAGAGRYRLDASPRAEHVGGIDTIVREGAPEAIIALLDCIAAENRRGRTSIYPGSPAIAARLLRADDRLRLAELHPKDYAQLHRQFASDQRVTATREDGYALLASELPPRERRGIVMIDPNYELANEGKRLLDALGRGLGRFRHGTYLIWMPFDGKLDVPRFERAYLAMAPPKTLVVDLVPPAPSPGAIASRVWIVNPPFQAVAAIQSVARHLGARTSCLVPE